MREAQLKQRLPFLVGKGELLGVVGEDADAIDPLIDHAVEDTFLTVQIETPPRIERCRRDGEHSGIRCGH